MVQSLRVLALFGSVPLMGQERGNIEALAALRDGGCEVLCLVRPERSVQRLRTALSEANLSWEAVPFIDPILKGSRIRTIFRDAGKFVVSNAAFLRIIQKYKPTHIHAFNPYFVVNFWVGLLLTRIPLVYRAGDVPIQHNAFWRLVWRFILHRAARFVAISNFISGELIRSGAAAEKVEIIYNAIPRRLVTRKFDFPAGCAGRDIDRIAYLGAITAAKGVDILIDAWEEAIAHNPHAHLLLAGPITEWQGGAWANSLREKVRDHVILSRRVHFLGEVEDIQTFLAGCRFIVVPSIVSEALGVVVLEAKAVGIPAIVFRSGGLPEMIKDGVDGIVCAEKSAGALSKAICYYIDERDACDSHGRAARDSLDGFYNRQRFQSAWLIAYRGCAS